MNQWRGRESGYRTRPMPRVMRRTPESEEAYGYGYVDFLKDVVQKTVADTTAGFKRPTDFSDEEMMGMAFAGIGGGTKILKGLGKSLMKLPRFADSDEAVLFGRTMGKEWIPLMKKGMEGYGRRYKQAMSKYMKTGENVYGNQAVKEGTKSQLYREALEILMGEMK